MTPSTPRIPTVIALAAVVSLLVTLPVLAQDDEEELGWSDEAELSFVITSGNSESSTLGFRNTLRYGWVDGQLIVEGGGLRTETSRISRTPIGSGPDDFQVVETSSSELTAENYYFRGRYEREVRDRFFVFGASGWTRNEFAGVRNRSFGSGGVGNIWLEDDTARWRTSYGISVTREEQVAGAASTFAGLRISSEYERQLTDSTVYENGTILDENLDETEDLRVDTLNSVSVSITESLALKVSLQLLFDNQPSVRLRPLQLPSGLPADIDVPVQADKLDTLLNVALVISF